MVTPDEVKKLMTKNREKDLQAKLDELHEAANFYAHLIQVERFDRDDTAVHRAYERLRKALQHCR